MTAPADVLREVSRAGIRVSIAESGNLYIEPLAALTPELRELLVGHKPEVLAFLHEAERTAVLLVQAAMRACDTWHDSPEARAVMRAEVLATPPEQQAELLEHFQEQYGHVEVPHQHAANSGAKPSAPMCRACAHRLRAGTCSEPVAAGLAEAFTVVWPPAGHGAGCPAFRRLGSDAKGAAR